MPQPNFLAGAQPPPQGQDQGQGGAGGGQRPVIKSILMQNMDNQQGGESITFVFADGFKATETLRELIQMGVDPQAIQAVAQVLEDAADKVHDTNKGGMAPRMMGGMPQMGGGPPDQGGMPGQ